MTTTSAPLGSTARTNQLLATASKTTGIAAPTFSEKSSGRDELPAGIGYQTYNPDGSVRSSQTSAQKQASDASGIATGQDTPEGIGGELKSVVPPAQAGQPPPPVNPGQTGMTAFNQATGSTPTPIAGGGSTTTADKYQAALTAAQGSGTAAPQDAGAARSAATAYTNAVPTGMSTGGQSMYDQSPELQGILKLATDYFNPQEQQKSLVDQYDQLYQDSGLGSIDKQILNAENVINGTEDDVRNEIQKAGGFGTESQVQAMSLARNKSLLQNYNNLLQTKQMATDHLNTMMNLSSQDRQYAQQQFTAQLGLFTTLANFRQSATNNVKEGFNNLVAKVGYAGAYSAYSKDPAQLANIEQIMGLAPGGLQQLSTQPDLDIEAKQAQIDASRASTANAYSNIAKNNADLIANKEAKANTIKSAASKADNTLAAVGTALKQVNGFSSGTIGGYSTLIPGSPSKNLESTIKTVQSALALDQLAALKANSPNGASGLGAASDREGDWLASNVANLDVGQSSEQLKQNLQTVQTHYVNYLTSLGYGYDAATGTVIAP